MNRVVGAAVLLGAAACASAAPQNKPGDVVHYRQHVMSLIEWNFAPMGAMVKGKLAWDVKAFALRAERVRAFSDQVLEGFVNASNSGGVETDAEAAIWQDFDDFKARLDDFSAAAKALDDIAKSGDEAKMKEQFHKTAEACKACHEKYKAS
jgi:cytochrome c556